MRTILIMNKDSFVGREYLTALINNNMPLELIISVGENEDPGNKLELERTSGRWNPKTMKNLLGPGGIALVNVKELNCKETADLLKKNNSDLVIQGGVGIIRQELLSIPKIGFLNIHPGRLPRYRGCTAPEWQIYYGAPVFITAHLIDDGIDTGPIVHEEEMPIDLKWDYYDFRSNIYKHCAIVLINSLIKIDENLKGGTLDRILKYQEQNNKNYFQPIRGQELEYVKNYFNQNTIFDRHS